MASHKNNGTGNKKNKKDTERVLTVSEIAHNYDLKVSEVLNELKELKLKKRSGSDIIEDEHLEKVIEHFENISQKESQDNQSAVKNDTAEIHLKSPIIVKQLAEAIGKKPPEIVKKLMQKNILASINQAIDPKTADEICKDFGLTLILDRREKKQVRTEAKEEQEEFRENPEDLQDRPPVVAFLGHVDHGKTSIQDAIRKTNVVKGESGGITQHTGASVIKHDGKDIVFIDTPGHEAFTQMRARGANVTDIVVLVVAADDGFMPQTVEAMNHAKAAGVPIIVAINKVDLHSADPEKVLLHMQQNNLMSEDWGGEIGTVRVSATTGQGLDDLLERILLEAEMLELKANPKRMAECFVLEAEVKSGMGSTVNAIVKNGSIKLGDPILCGQYSGKVKALLDHHGKRVKKIGPSYPVKVLGLSGVPEAGAKFVACNSEKKASETALKRKEEKRTETLSSNQATSLEDLFSTIEANKKEELKLIIKTDVQGTVEAIKDSLSKLPSEKIEVNVILSGVGAISESDVLLASASNAIVVGFHVKINSGVNAVAKREGVEIRLYSIIYELLEDIEDALVGRLAPEEREREVGKAVIQKIFQMTKGPKVCGCRVEKGVIKVGSKARVYRGNELIFTGTLESLKHYQDNVKQIKAGQECGIKLNNFMDFKEDDVIQVYDVELRKASL
ncbi:MAG: translation initiation factor IF-2 [Victivallales bacterium]|nr:translation initiation factor IF-2 [Victivallales bacterium]MCF7888921.1 translation initiation factor IF-2 [Victivallales bacterium]